MIMEETNDIRNFIPINDDDVNAEVMERRTNMKGITNNEEELHGDGLVDHTQPLKILDFGSKAMENCHTNQFMDNIVVEDTNTLAHGPSTMDVGPPCLEPLTLDPLVEQQN
ncbi:hypothetical protein VNO78_01637 [Psophocarpus tetragonolobus]|uniref:Uncharacterized protein n=1 Tax=Psophocarpus tetragonolobus TaxID=3891 RepID=A0AAN9SY41_PSOTE